MGQTGWKPRKGRTRQSCRRQSPPTFIRDWDGVRKRSLGAARGTIWEAGVSEAQGMEKRLTHLEPVSTWYREWHLGYCCHCLISSLCVFITKVKHVPWSKNSLCFESLTSSPALGSDHTGAEWHFPTMLAHYFVSGITNPRIKWHSLNTARTRDGGWGARGNPTRGALKQSK